MSKVFAGIDPGRTGGLGIVDSRRGFLGAWRWNAKDPIFLYNKLILFRELIGGVYLEDVRVFPKEEKGFITQNQGLLVNQGIWQGWLFSLGLSFLIVHPHTWQTPNGLFRWRKRIETDPRQHSPLSLARLRWPAAPLEFEADDGKAVALLLADLSCQDHQKGFDRGAVLEVRHAKLKAKKQRERKATKALKTLQF